MSYWTTRTQNVTSTDNFGLGGKSVSGQGGEFYEIEPAVVLDVILDKEHPLFKQYGTQTQIDSNQWPSAHDGSKPLNTDIDYTWIGKTLIRLQFSSQNTAKEKLIWASPIDASICEYPLINEIVMAIKCENQYFYYRRINSKNFPNEAVDFSMNRKISGQENVELYTNTPYKGQISTTSHDGQFGFKGVAGKYFCINNNIRRIKRYEGDTVIESRFGQSIRFGAYDDNRKNDIGIGDYANHGGNPMIILRNRQRRIIKKNETLKLENSPNAATILGTEEEKNAGGYLEEDINHDGTSIYITSGQTISKWVTTCYKKMFGTGEEVTAFSGTSNFKYPELSGNQLVLNTDRIILSSRQGEFFQYSKKRFGIVTDDEYSVDAHNQIVLTTNTKTVINSPAIYLGQYDETGEPAILGQTLANWLSDLCTWIENHTHWHLHSHVDAGSPSPEQTQLPVQLQQLRALKENLNTILSRRVFVTGGGFAPGQNGGDIQNGSRPTKINIIDGKGVPGGWKGANKR